MEFVKDTRSIMKMADKFTKASIPALFPLWTTTIKFQSRFHSLPSRMSWVTALDHQYVRKITLFSLDTNKSPDTQIKCHMGPIVRKTSSGVSDKARLQLVQSATETSQKIELSREAGLDMILFKMWITKTLNSLHVCEGWSAPLLVANPEDRFSRVEAQLPYMQRLKKTL